MANLIADKTYYLNADKSQIVEEGDPAAAWLLVAKDGEIAQEEADKYGLVIGSDKQPKAADRAEQAKAAEQPEPETPKQRATKRSAGPSEDK